jgi:hypothetical protein
VVTTVGREHRQLQLAVVGGGAIGKVEGEGDGVAAGSFDDVAHDLGTSEASDFLGLLPHSIHGRQGMSEKVDTERPPGLALHDKVLQKL